MEYSGEWHDLETLTCTELDDITPRVSDRCREKRIVDQVANFLAHMIRLEVEPAEINHIHQLLMFASNPGDTPKETYSQLMVNFIQFLAAQPPKTVVTNFYKSKTRDRPYDAIMRSAYGDDYMGEKEWLTAQLADYQ